MGVRITITLSRIVFATTEEPKTPREIPYALNTMPMET